MKLRVRVAEERGDGRPVGTTEREDRGWKTGEGAEGVVAGSGGRGVWRLDRSYNIA